MTSTSLGDLPDETAPDGSEVRFLSRTERGSMAEFRLPAGATARAVRHRTVEELWYVTSGVGELWRSSDDRDETSDDDMIVELRADVSLAITPGTSFQFRTTGTADLRIVGVTMPPWPGDGEAEFVDGYWPPTPP